MKQKLEWIVKNIARYIDIKFLVKKIAIFIFSGLIAVAPIFFVCLGQVSTQKEAFDTVQLLTKMESSTDVVYALVSLSTIVLADVLEDEKGKNTAKFISGLFHVITVVFGILIYAHYKTHNVDAYSVKMLNGFCAIVVFGLSFLSYINLSITEKRKEG